MNNPKLKEAFPTLYFRPTGLFCPLHPRPPFACFALHMIELEGDIGKVEGNVQNVMNYIYEHFPDSWIAQTGRIEASGCSTCGYRKGFQTNLEIHRLALHSPFIRHFDQTPKPYSCFPMSVSCELKRFPKNKRLVQLTYLHQFKRVNYLGQERHLQAFIPPDSPDLFIKPDDSHHVIPFPEKMQKPKIADALVLGRAIHEIKSGHWILQLPGIEDELIYHSEKEFFDAYLSVDDLIFSAT